MKARDGEPFKLVRCDSKTFETVDHNILLKKVQYYGALVNEIERSVAQVPWKCPVSLTWDLYVFVTSVFCFWFDLVHNL